MAAQPTPRPRAPRPPIQPDLSDPLCDTPLIRGSEFHYRLRAVLSVPKEELEAHVRTNPDPLVKRGRKAGR
jgi:hypothetical protein